jgi:3-oxoacyl-[acyl-carrier-protein] synthase II
VTLRAADRAVAIVGMGVSTPAGNTVDALWDALTAGRPHARPFHDHRLPAGADALVATVDGLAPDAYLSPVEARRLDRVHLLAVKAAQDALDACGGAWPPPERCAVACGVGFGAAAYFETQLSGLLTGGLRGLSPLTVPVAMPSSIASHLSLRHGFRGPSVTVSAACASGAAAIAEGVELIRRGAADLVIAGGGDSLVHYGAMCAFMRLDVMSRRIDDPEHASRPFDAERDGFVMGEGSGFVVLSRPADALAHGREVLGLVLGHASTSDAHHLVAPPPDGAGALACMRLALADADVDSTAVGHVNAHGTSTVLNDLAEAAALETLFRDSMPPVTAVKGSTGHLIAGSGAVEAIVAVESVRRRSAPPVAGLRMIDPEISVDVVIGSARRLADGPALSNSFGFGGANTSLVIGAV